jgi:RNA polymerase sigma factor for flagellar operon FliA
MYNAKGKIRSSDMIEENLPLVSKEAKLIKLRLPSHIELDDLVQSGTLGLLDAVKKYTPSDGVKFEVYARQRIRGSIMDELRKSDWAPRRVRDMSKHIEMSIRSLTLKLGRSPEDREIARAMGVSMDEYGKMLMETNRSSVLSLDVIGIDALEEQTLEHYSSPLEALLEGGEKGRVADAISNLQEKEQQLLALLYQEEMTLKEIGAVFGVSESRICQLHSQTLAKLRVKLSD